MNIIKHIICIYLLLICVTSYCVLPLHAQTPEPSEGSNEASTTTELNNPQENPPNDQPTKPIEEEWLEGTVTKIIEEKQIEVMGAEQTYQKLEIAIHKGSLSDKTIEVESGDMSVSDLSRYKVGDALVISYNTNQQGEATYYIVDYVRRAPMLYLLLIFLATVLVVGRLRGIASIIGMALSFYFIFKLILPNISVGNNPVMVVILASLFIVPITYYTSHGFNNKTNVAIIATFISLLIGSVLVAVFAEMAKLTGYTSDEVAYLQAAKANIISVKNLLLAGMIIGILGVLDDVTVSQAGIIFQLKRTNPKLAFKELYTEGMKLGHDHVASMVNTLILVYAGASLPLLLLFIDNPKPIADIINYEIVAEEIIRTLIGSTTLIIAVPISAVMAAIIAAKVK